MYKSTDYEHEQLSFINFNMACGMQLDMNNEWMQMSSKILHRKVMRSLHRSVSSFLHSLVRSFLHSGKQIWVL